MQTSCQPVMRATRVRYAEGVPLRGAAQHGLPHPENFPPYYEKRSSIFLDVKIRLTQTAIALTYGASSYGYG